MGSRLKMVRLAVALTPLFSIVAADVAFQLVNDDKTIRDPAFPQYCLIAYDDPANQDSLESGRNRVLLSKSCSEADIDDDMKWEYDQTSLQIKSLEHNKCWTTSNRAEKARIVLHPCNSTNNAQKFEYIRGQIKPFGRFHTCVMAPLGKMLRLSPCNVDMFGTAEPILDTNAPEPTTSLDCACDDQSQLPIPFCNLQDKDERYDTSCQATRHNCNVSPPKVFVECSILDTLGGFMT